MGGRIVECGKHGESGAAFVCHHLAVSLRHGPRGLGFYTPDPQEDEPQAWRRLCDAALAQAGEWNDESEAVAGVTLICQGCFEDARVLNWS